MEKLIQKELFQNAQNILKSPSGFTPSYDQTRANALEYFNQFGIPTKENENWLYTNIAKYLAPRFANSTNEKKADPQYVVNPNAILMFNNGHFNRTDSVMPSGISISAPKITNSIHDSFDALNIVSATDAITFTISPNTILDYPITLLHTADELGVNKQISPRIHFNIGANSNLKIVEVFTSAQNDLFQYTTNAHTSFALSNNAHVKHIKLINEAKLSTHISLTKAEVSRDANFETYSIDLGNLVSRNNLEVHLNEANATAAVHGVFNLKESEHADVFSTIHHHSPNTFSDQLYKGIINHTANGAFTGKIIIDELAIGVVSNQLNKNILLSKKAHINTRPQLLVSADDVKCAHGATVGELSADEEFYLISRGISKTKARKMLALGFAHEILYKINDQIIFNYINKFLEKTEF